MGRDIVEIPLAIESLNLWRQMNALVGAETGFRQRGTLYLIDRRKDLEQHERWLEAARSHRIDARFIANGELDRIVPGGTRQWLGALHTPTDGTAEPSKAAPAIAEAARRCGARIVTHCAVRGIETEGGRIAGVVTEKGRVRCGAVILAGGAWSRLFCGNIGVQFPQLKVLASVIRTEPLAGAPDAAVGAPDFSFRKRTDGGYTIAHRNANIATIVPDSFRLFFDFLPALVANRRELRLRIGRRFLDEWWTPRQWDLDSPSPFEQVRVLDPKPSQASLVEGRRRLSRAFPVFAGLKVAEQWAGMIDVTPDATPVISRVSAIPGFVLASGFSGHGFGVGPAAGQLACDLVTGRPPTVDPAPFRFERFGRGAARSAAYSH